MDSLVLLGRQPVLGMAEVESLYGGDNVEWLGTHAAIVHVDPCLLAFDRLGGSTKFCKILTTLETTNWKQIEKFLIQVAPGHSQSMPEGKMTLGLSVIGLDVPLKQLEATGLSVKRAIKKTGRNVRLVPNKSPELNTAQVLHNKLTTPTGWELVFLRDGDKVVVAQTVKVQDIDSYTVRDRERPKRDTRVGYVTARSWRKSSSIWPSAPCPRTSCRTSAKFRPANRSHASTSIRPFWIRFVVLASYYKKHY